MTYKSNHEFYEKHVYKFRFSDQSDRSYFGDKLMLNYC